MTDAELKTVQVQPEESRKRWTKMAAKAVYAIILALILTVCGIYTMFQMTNSVSAAITLNSVFAENGRNPDGTPFDIMELLHEDVLNRAAEKLDGNMTAQELRSHLTVSDTMSASSFSQLEQSIFDGESQNTYFPTGYRVTYSTVSEQIRKEGFGEGFKSILRSLILPSKSEILSAVLSSYEEYYEQKHLRYEPLFDVDWSEADEMDHYNRAEFMDDALQRLLRFLYAKNGDHVARPEVNDGTSVYDLIVEMVQGPSRSIENYRAYVIQNGLTDDGRELLRQFAYMEHLYNEENSRAAQRYLVLRDAIEMYDSTTTKVVFIPALDGEKSFYMNRTKVGLDYLTEEADTTKLQADTAAYVAKHYADLQTYFAEGANPAGNTAEKKAYAEHLYESIKAEIQLLANEAEQLSEEGSVVNQDKLAFSEPGNSATIVSVAISAAKMFALLLMAAYVVVYSVKMISGHKAQKEQGGEA